MVTHTRHEGDPLDLGDLLMSEVVVATSWEVLRVLHAQERHDAARQEAQRFLRMIQIYVDRCGVEPTAVAWARELSATVEAEGPLGMEDVEEGRRCLLRLVDRAMAHLLSQIHIPETPVLPGAEDVQAEGLAVFDRDPGQIGQKTSRPRGGVCS